MCCFIYLPGAVLFFRNQIIPSCGNKWREQASSIWSLLITCFAVSFISTRMIFWTWWSSLDWSSSLPNLQEKTFTLFPVNFEHHLTPLAKLSHFLQILVHYTFVFSEVLFLMVFFLSLCHDVSRGAVQLDPNCLTCSTGHLDSSLGMSKITSWSLYARNDLSRSFWMKYSKMIRQLMVGRKCKTWLSKCENFWNTRCKLCHTSCLGLKTWLMNCVSNVRCA